REGVARHHVAEGVVVAQGTGRGGWQEVVASLAMRNRWWALLIGKVRYHYTPSVVVVDLVVDDLDVPGPTENQTRTDGDEACDAANAVARDVCIVVVVDAVIAPDVTDPVPERPGCATGTLPVLR